MPEVLLAISFHVVLMLPIVTLSVSAAAKCTVQPVSRLLKGLVPSSLFSIEVTVVGIYTLLASLFIDAFINAFLLICVTVEGTSRVSCSLPAAERLSKCPVVGSI